MTDPLSLTFGALADPTRRAILARLAEGEAAVGELAARTRRAASATRSTGSLRGSSEHRLGRDPGGRAA